MDFVLTQHAHDRLQERGLMLEWVARVLAAQLLILHDRTDSVLRHYLARIPELDNRVLRMIIDEQSDPVRVVTFFVERTMRGKL